MAIQKQTDMGNGTSGTYWALSGLRRIRRAGPDTAVEAEFGLWVDKAGHASGLPPLSILRRIKVTVPGANPDLDAISNACEADLLRAQVVQVEPVAPRAAVAADKADDGVAVPEVKEVKAVRGVRPGLLAGGSTVA